MASRFSPPREWDQLVPMPPRSTKRVYVEVRLYKSDKPETVYRQVHVTLNDLGDSKNRKMQC